MPADNRETFLCSLQISLNLSQFDFCSRSLTKPVPFQGSFGRVPRSFLRNVEVSCLTSLADSCDPTTRLSSIADSLLKETQKAKPPLTPVRSSTLIRIWHGDVTSYSSMELPEPLR